jgi:hypothetical protein
MRCPGLDEVTTPCELFLFHSHIRCHFVSHPASDFSHSHFILRLISIPIPPHPKPLFHPHCPSSPGWSTSDHAEGFAKVLRCHPKGAHQYPDREPPLQRHPKLPSLTKSAHPESASDDFQAWPPGISGSLRRSLRPRLPRISPALTMSLHSKCQFKAGTGEEVDCPMRRGVVRIRSPRALRMGTGGAPNVKPGRWAGKHLQSTHGLRGCCPDDLLDDDHPDPAGRRRLAACCGLRQS